MKAIRVHEYGGPEVLRYEEVEAPRPQAGEALVEVRAAGVNFADIYSRVGRYRPQLPWIPGSEAAGTVREVGDGVTQVRVGDRVAWATAPAGLPLRHMAVDPTDKAMRDTTARTYAELAVTPTSQLVHLPEGISFEQAAGVMVHGVTAHYLVHGTYAVGAGDRVLVHAGAGGVGLLLTQMAKQLGATVYTTVSTEEKAAVSREMGADAVILYTRQDFAQVVNELTRHQGATVIFDSVGGPTFDKDFDCLAARGHLVLFGLSGGPVKPFDPTVLNTGSFYLTRPSLGHYTLGREQLVTRADAVFSGIATGRIRLRIHAAYQLRQAAQAHRELEGRRAIGKLLLLPG